MVKQRLYTTAELGEPGDQSQMVSRRFPFDLYLMGDKDLRCRNFYGNKRIVDSVIDAFWEIYDHYGIEYIRANGLDNYGGCYNYRKSRGYEEYSDHAWGMAIDYLPQFGAMGVKPTIPKKIIQIFEKRGFIWGGDWKRPDGMHWSARRQ